MKKVIFVISCFVSLLFVSATEHHLKGTMAVLSQTNTAHWLDRNEAWTDRYMRLKPLGAILDDLDSRDRARLLATAFHESRFARYVAEDRCDDGPRGEEECDGGLARGFFQLHRSTCPTLWAMKPSTERLKIEVKCALSYLNQASNFCYNVDLLNNKDSHDTYNMNGYRGSCKTKDLIWRNKTAEVFQYVILNGWPKLSKEYIRVSNPPTHIRRMAISNLSNTSQVGNLILLENNYYGLIEYHFNEIKYWHTGISVFSYDPN